MYNGACRCLQASLVKIETCPNSQKLAQFCLAATFPANYPAPRLKFGSKRKHQTAAIRCNRKMHKSRREGKRASQEVDHNKDAILTIDILTSLAVS